MVVKSKRYVELAKQIEPQRAYTAEEAISLVKQSATAKFDETVELHLRTNADPRQSDQLVRGVTVLPHGLGKEVRILVFAEGEAAEGAIQAGADHVGSDDLIKRIEDGWLEFDVGLAVPDVMSRIGKLGRILGRRGLMPNPRTGTMVQPQDLSKAVEEARKGRLEFRMDRTAIIHSTIGKASFQDNQLIENLAALMDAIVRATPTGIKGGLLRSVAINTTMGPSIKVNPSSLLTITL